MAGLSASPMGYVHRKISKMLTEFLKLQNILQSFYDFEKDNLIQ